MYRFLFKCPYICSISFHELITRYSNNFKIKTYKNKNVFILDIFIIDIEFIIFITKKKILCTIIDWAVVLNLDFLVYFPALFIHYFDHDLMISPATAVCISNFYKIYG